MIIDDLTDCEDEVNIFNNSDHMSYLETVSDHIGEITINDWVLVRFYGKKSIKHYVGQVINKTSEEEVLVNFTRKKLSKEKTDGEIKTLFIFPTVKDCWPVPESDIILTLPMPNISRRGEITFEVSFDKYNLQ